MFGLLILIHSYAQAASGLTKFQSWQVIVRYGGEALSRRRRPASSSRRPASRSALDLVSGIGGMVLAMALLPLIGGWFGIPAEYHRLSRCSTALLHADDGGGDARPACCARSTAST